MGGITAATTIEVIREFTHIRARRRSRTDAATLARWFANALTLLTPQPEDLELGMNLFERHPRLGAFDSVLAAVVLNRDAEALVSADAAFGDIAQLRWVDPAAPALDSLITR